MCREHWFSLSKPLRDAIWKEYQPGQEQTKRPSIRYLAVQQRAIGELVFKPNDEAAAVLAAPYLLRSHKFRVLAIATGEGDPLEGIASMPAEELEPESAVAVSKEVETDGP